MNVEDTIEKNRERCQHCGRRLYPKKEYTFTFKKWATPAYVFFLSLMLIGIDFADSGALENSNQGWYDMFISRTQWSRWASVGLWIVFISAQLLRSRPGYGWAIVPFNGMMMIIFLFFLDRLNPPNNGLLGLDWSWYAIIPMFIVIVCFPIIARLARVEPSHLDQLQSLVETLAGESEN